MPTLDQIALDTATKIVHAPDKTVELIAKACIEYARSIVPEALSHQDVDWEKHSERWKLNGHNDCRNQILTKIETDEKGV